MRSDRPLWTTAEEDQLALLAGDVPLEMLVFRYRVWAERMGQPPRTEYAIRRHLWNLGLSCDRVKTGSWVTSGGAAEILGCSRHRIDGWLEMKPIAAILRPQRWSGCQYVARTSWRNLAREMPRVLGGFEADRLFQLLEDRELADSVAARYPMAISDWRVRCIETGKVWHSAVQAAADLHVTPSAITLAIRQRRPLRVLGLSFERLRVTA